MAVDVVVRGVATKLGVLGPDDRLTALDSLAMVELVVALEEALAISLFQTQFKYSDFRTVQTVVELVARAGGGSAIPAAASSQVAAVAADDADDADGDDADLRELAAYVSGLAEPEVADELAAWSAVELAPESWPAANLAGARRELGERLLAQHRIDADRARPLARRHAASTPATFTQRRMWNMHEAGDHIRLGNAHALAIRGALDVEALRGAFAALAERQAAIRSVFALDGDALVQTIRARGPELEVIDLSAHAGDRTARARELFADIARPHELGRSVFRAQLVRLDEREHVLMLAPHHIVMDGFSHRVMWSDLSALYRGEALPALDFAFGDFCFWQTGLERRPVGMRQLAFWRKVVEGYGGLEIPGDLALAPRDEPLPLYDIGDAPLAIDGATWTAVTARCGELKVLPFSVIAAALVMLLSFRGKRDEAIVSGGSHQRTRLGSERLIGTFVTPYPMRLGFSDGTTLASAVERCHHAVLEHHAQQGVAPVPALAAWAEVSRYNLNYQVQAADEALATLGGATIELLPWNQRVPRSIHDLALYLSQRATGVRGRVVYNAERFSPAFARELVAQLVSIIAAISAEPNRTVGSLRS